MTILGATHEMPGVRPFIASHIMERELERSGRSASKQGSLLLSATLPMAQSSHARHIKESAEQPRNHLLVDIYIPSQP